MKKISDTIIRVKFKKDKGGFYRSTRIRKYVYEEVILKDDGETIKETKEIIIYRPYLPIGSPKELNPNDFITEWKKGETPQRNPIKKYEIDLRAKELDLLCKLTKKSRKDTRELVLNNKISTSDYYISAEDKAKAKVEHRSIVNKRRLGSANSKVGTVTVEFTGPNEKRMTKTFPSKGLLRNTEFNTWAAKYFNESSVIKFKRKRGSKDLEIKKSEEARIAYRGSEKHLKKKQKIVERRKKEYEELAKKSTNHSKKKGKNITNVQPLKTVKKPTELKEVKLENKTVKKAA